MKANNWVYWHLFKRKLKRNLSQRALIWMRRRHEGKQEMLSLNSRQTWFLYHILTIALEKYDESMLICELSWNLVKCRGDWLSPLTRRKKYIETNRRALKWNFHKAFDLLCRCEYERDFTSEIYLSHVYILTKYLAKKLGEHKLCCCECLLSRLCSMRL